MLQVNNADGKFQGGEKAVTDGKRMSEITKTIVAVIGAFCGFGFLYTIFKFIILDYFKQIKKNKETIGEHETRITVLEDRSDDKRRDRRSGDKI